MLSTLSLLLPIALSLKVSAQSTLSGVDAPTSTYPATPMADKRFNYPGGIPYQADADNLIRGTQYGYNYCDDSTEGQDSKCQTSFLNYLDDFCLWAPPEPNSVIGDTEGETVAWCTKPGRGTRLIPEGALTGVQFMKTPEYVQVVGFVDQTKLNIEKADYGGEMDPHGADLRGNPLGGLVYSTNFGGNNESYSQVIEWHNFMGSNAFCFKACDPSGSRAPALCQHIYDRIGCAFNAPNEAKDGVFEACEGEPQDPPGIYTGADGATSTYTQPAEGIEPSPSDTYTPKIPASSNCVTFTSSAIYSALGTPSSSGSGSGSASPTGSGSNSGSGTGTSSSSNPTGSSGDSDGGDGGDGAITLVAMWGMSIGAIVATSLYLA